MIRKALICQWFGPLPEWFPLWQENIARLQPHGYDLLFEDDIDLFAARVHDRLGIHFPDGGDGRKVCDYRAAFGLLYEDELRGYDFWGHTDIDCIYGRVQEWMTDEFLSGLDVYGNHFDYVSGPWSLFRNTEFVNSIFMQVPGWKPTLEHHVTTGWVETTFTHEIERCHAEGSLVRHFETFQTASFDDFSKLHWEGDRLMDGETEVMMAHFRRTKEYPQGCLSS